MLASYPPVSQTIRTIKMATSFQTIFSSPSEMSSNITESMKSAKNPLDLLIDYHNFWAKVAGIDSLVVDKSQDISNKSMDRLSETMTNMVEEMKNVFGKNN